jgi:carboxymethylenebutenolidase
MQPACCVDYYPGGIGNFATEEPSCPVMLHFGGADTHIGKEQIEAVRTAHPEVEIFVYEGAQHGFHCDARASYDPKSAAVAWPRTIEFLKTHLA